MVKARLAVLTFLLYATAGLAATPRPAEPARGKTNLVVHEWGTFLSVQGSNGVTLGGMVESEEALPPFVESRSNNGVWERTRFISKMETPVTYFYTDRPQTVQVRVEMPRGVLTHWYPMVRAFGPAPSAPKVTASGSFLDWRPVYLIPHNPRVALDPAEDVPTLWRVKPDDPWRFARQTDAALVKVFSRTPGAWSDYDYEKFLFYRGLGTMELPLRVVSMGDGPAVRLTLENRSPHPLRGLIAIEVENKRVRFGALDGLAGGATRDVSAASVLKHAFAPDVGVPELKALVADALVSAGLYAKEAQAMVNTWEKSYFRTPGLRVLYLLPRPVVDAAIPIQIRPAPDRLVRVMIGRVELMTPATERSLERLLTDLVAPDPRVRKVARDGLERLGRFREPMLRRIAAGTNDAAVRAQAEALIARTAGQ